MTTRPRFNLGDTVRIITVGCDCDCTSASRCWRHHYIGFVSTIETRAYEDGSFSYILDADADPNLEGEHWFDDELEAVT